MEYPKVEKELFKVDNENLQKLASLFPGAVKDGQLDINALKEELGTFEEVGQEKYELNWAGKQNAKKEARKNVLGKTLRYIEGDGVNEDSTQNIYIEGDNLEVLKLLRKNYYGKIKMIYIDPPYNTGNDFVYNDNFSMSQEELEQIQGQRNEYGERLQKNSKDSAKFHTNWLNMMYPRLQLAKDLLTDDGVIFISIDDNEIFNLKLLCDKIFGESNYQATVTYVRKTSGKQDSTNFMKSTEYILIYSKTDAWDCKPLLATEQVTDRYNKTDEDGKKYRETDLRKTGTGDRREDRPLMFYPFYYNPLKNDLVVAKDKNGSYIKDGYIEILPIKPDGSEGRWRWGYETAINNIDYLIARIMPKYESENKYTIYEKDYIDKNGEVRTIKEHTSWDRKEFNSDNAMKEFKNLNFSNQLFPFPKSSAFIKHIIYLANSEKSTILDFFSGSATTAHACMQLNSEDNGNRKFILVQLPEATDEGSEARKAGFENICEIGKERIRRAGQKIKEEIEQGNQQLKLGEEPKQIPDIGFKVFRVGETTLNWEKLRLQGKDIYHDYLAGTSEKDKLDFTPDFQNDLNVVYEIMLRQEGLPLTSNIEKLTDIGSRTYLVKNSYLISLEETITQEMIEKLSALNPLPFKFVFRDSAFDDDIVFKDETFRRLNALIDKNTSNEKKTYTVEFI